MASFAYGGIKRYVLNDIANSDKAEYNAFVLIENFNDLARDKQDKSTTTATLVMAWPIVELGDPARSEDNAIAINENFRDLARTKVDVSTPGLVEPRYLIENLLDPDKSDENTAKINEMWDDFHREKADR